MSDRALRTTERLSYDDPEAAARWLHKRARDGKVLRLPCDSTRCIDGHGPGGLPDVCPRCNGTGSLPVEETLAFLVYCGHEPALSLLDRDHWPGGFTGDKPNAPRIALAAWAQGLTRWGRPVAVRAALAAAREALRDEEVHRGVRWDGDTYRDAGMVPSMDCTDEPAVARLLAPRRALEAVEASLADQNWDGLPDAFAPLVRDPLWHRFAAAVGDLTSGHGGREMVRWLEVAAQVLGGPDGPQRIRAAVCRALVEWALNP